MIVVVVYGQLISSSMVVVMFALAANQNENGTLTRSQSFALIFFCWWIGVLLAVVSLIGVTA